MATRYVIQRIALGSAVKFGLALGLLGSLLPGCLLALLIRQIVSASRQGLESASQGRFSVLGQNIAVNLVDLAHLGPTLETLRGLDALGWLLPVALALGWTVIGGLAVAATVLLLAVGFNVLAAVSGGLEFQVSDAGRPTLPRSP
jgi:hypothetical protein